MNDEKMRISECKKCGYLEYSGILDQSGGICSGCASEAKEVARQKEEKKQRREDSGYFQNTGRYRKKTN